MRKMSRALKCAAKIAALLRKTPGRSFAVCLVDGIGRRELQETR
jgi:hypothetical protein